MAKEGVHSGVFLVLVFVFVAAICTLFGDHAVIKAALQGNEALPPVDDSKSFSPAFFQTMGSSFARAFPSWPSEHQASWCVPQKGRLNEATTGLLYVKTPKTGSSTIASIVRRIAISQGNKTFHDESLCNFRNHHIAPIAAYGKRDRERSFLWTSVRHPTKRAISRVFYTYVSLRNWTTDDESILRALDTKSWQMGVVSKGAGGHQLKYVTMKSIPDWSAWNETNPTKVIDPETVQDNVRKVMESYDFIMVTERMDESVVALQLLLGIQAGDMLSTSAKVSGGWTINGIHQCVKMKPSFVSPRIKAFLASDEWYAKNYGDFLLYAAANKSLDLTIKSLGRSRFDTALTEYRKLKALVDEVCSPKLVLPCTSEGVPQEELARSHCYFFDEGCGYRCIEQLLINVSKVSISLSGEAPR